MKEHVLIVEDARMFSKILQNRLEDRGFSVVVAESMAAARKEIDSGDDRFFIALLDLNLPDAPNGEIVDYVTACAIPCIVFTGYFDDELREQMIRKRVVDYVTKEDPSSIDFVIHLVCRIHENQKTRVLVVDDSVTARNYVLDLLAIQQYLLAEAASGEEALKVLAKNPDIKVVLTDYMMPGMDGFELTKKIRLKYGRNQVAIIGMSGYGNNILSAKFIKYGASDFIIKPFLVEEFHCRVSQNVEILTHIRALEDAVTKDFLTGLYNRRHLFSIGNKLFASAQRKQISIATAILDIDYFKQVNDRYGHDAGDLVLRHLADLFRKHLRETDVVARLGGEEFCLLLVNMDRAALEPYLRQLCTIIAGHDIPCSAQTVNITVSIGACAEIRDSLDTTLSIADACLYRAKGQGRNMVVIE
jgi:diguanylate cyclase (GGDEF)-like protein